MRNAVINRKTAETDISLALTIDGEGKYDITTGCGFLDHMLALFAKHGHFDIVLKCVGDIDVDLHHTAEDIGICLGQAFSDALGDKRGINRYGSTILPMDEALILSAVDLSGRACLVYNLGMLPPKVGRFDTELFEEFWVAFTRTAACNLHIKRLDGKNTHHIIEGSFKSVARSLRDAVKIDRDHADELPSTKGVL